MYLKKLSTFIAVPILALSLASCGSDSKKGSSVIPGSDKSASAKQKPSLSTAPKGDSDSDSSADSNDSGDKPLKEAIVNNMEKRAHNTLGARQGANGIRPFMSCAVDKFYNKVSPSTLKTLANGQQIDPTKQKDIEEIRKATKECASSSLRVRYQPGSNYGGNQPGSNYGGNRPGSNYGGNQPGSNYGGNQPGSNYGGNQPGSNYGGNQSDGNYDSNQLGSN